MLENFISNRVTEKKNAKYQMSIIYSISIQFEHSKIYRSASEMKRLCNDIYRKKSARVKRKREPRWKDGERKKERERNFKDRGLQGDYSFITRNKSSQICF